jgi:hypothetical protein
MTPAASRDWFQVYGAAPGGAVATPIPPVLAGNTLLIPAATGVMSSYSRNITTGLPTVASSESEEGGVLCQQFGIVTFSNMTSDLIDCSAGSLTSITNGSYLNAQYYGRYGIKYFCFDTNTVSGTGTFLYNTTLTGAGTVVALTTGSHNVQAVIPNPYTNQVYVFGGNNVGETSTYSTYTANDGVLTLIATGVFTNQYQIATSSAQCNIGVEPVNRLLVMSPGTPGSQTQVFTIGAGGTLTLIQQYVSSSLGPLCNASFSKDGAFIYQSTGLNDSNTTLAPITAAGVGTLTTMGFPGSDNSNSFGIMCGTPNYALCLRTPGIADVFQVNVGSALTLLHSITIPNPGGGLFLTGDFYP